MGVFCSQPRTSLDNQQLLRLHAIVICDICFHKIAKLLWSIRQCTYLVASVWILQLLISFQVELNQKLSRFGLHFLYTHSDVFTYWNICVRRLHPQILSTL